MVLLPTKCHQHALCPNIKHVTKPKSSCPFPGKKCPCTHSLVPSNESYPKDFSQTSLKGNKAMILRVCWISPSDLASDSTCFRVDVCLGNHRNWPIPGLIATKSDVDHWTSKVLNVSASFSGTTWGRLLFIMGKRMKCSTSYCWAMATRRTDRKLED